MGTTRALHEFIDILEAKQERNWNKLHEASLSRVWQHINDDDRGQFAILTSNRSANDAATNNRNFTELLGIVRSHGLGHIRLKGHWLECQEEGVPYSECPKDKLVDSAEPSILIPSIPLKLAKQLMDKYSQDAIIYIGPETNGEMTLFFSDGSTHNIGSFHPDAVRQAYSTIGVKKSSSFNRQSDLSHPAKERSFAFEWTAQSPGEVMLESIYNKKS